MGFLKGGVTFRRFRIQGPKPRMFGAEHLERLKANAFGTQKAAADPGIEAGWAGGQHIHDVEFTEAKNVYPDHLAFDLCVQVDKLPADRLKAYYEIELRGLSRDNPSGYPSARQKREAREAAKDRLEEEAKDGRYRKWKLYPVLWDAVRNEAYLGATSLAVGDRFAALFRLTFESNLFEQEPLIKGIRSIGAGSLAVDINKAAKDETLSAFTPGLPTAPYWCPDEATPDFLGAELLLWLWHKADTETDTIKLVDDSELTFMFSGGIRMDCPKAETGRDTLNHDSAIRMPEARAAARSGKLPRKAALTIVRHDEQFTFVINAETLAVSGAKLPKPTGDVNGRARDEERLQTVRNLAEAVDLLYQAFLARRLSSFWAGELADMQAWLKSMKTNAMATA